MYKLVWLIVLVGCAALPPHGAAKGQIPEPIYLSTERGLQLLRQSNYKEDYWRLSTMLVTQDTQTLCSVASSVTVLNALPAEAVVKPKTPIYFPYAYFTQESFFTQAVSDEVKMQQVLAQGMTLTQLGTSLGKHEVQANVTYAADTTSDEFRAFLKKDLGEATTYIIANYHRVNVGQEGGGHFSPIAAYHEAEDRVLILDVARFKYSPAWIELDRLFESMSTVDPSTGNSRGWIEVRGR